MDRLNWHYADFSKLTAVQVFDMLELRCEVFIVEQNCPYQDPDRKDRSSSHLLVYEDQMLVACLRIVPPGISYKEASIGRVCTRTGHRRTGLGKMLMRKALEHCKSDGYMDIRISAQLYLRKFYSDMGFIQVSEPYMEDNIPHIEMILKLSDQR